jgi:uncharacterized protein
VSATEIAPKEFAKITPDLIRKQIVDHLKTLGFKYIALDLQGFRSGSMNEMLSINDKD